MSKPKKTQVNGFRIMHGIVQEGGARFSVLVDKPISLTEIEQIATFMKYSVDQARAQIAAAKNQAEKKDHENMPLPEMTPAPMVGKVTDLGPNGECLVCGGITACRPGCQDGSKIL